MAIYVNGIKVKLTINGNKVKNQVKSQQQS